MQEAHPSLPAVDLRLYRAGLIVGVLSSIAFLGVLKDLAAVLNPAGRGEVVWGFLMLRYTSLQRVWFGYRLTGQAAWLATFPHLIVYAVSIYGLVGLKRWGWYVAFVYLLYIPLSDGRTCCSTRSAI